MRAISVLCGAGALAVLAACQTLPDLPDKAMSPGPAGPQYRFGDLARGPGNSDGTLVLLAFSGGGARAAAMAYGVLEVLHRTEIGSGPRRRTLLSEVDVISSTSGGSFTSAFYGLHRERMFARGADGLTLYERRYLRRSVSRRLAARVVRNIVRINSSAFNRSDIAAEYYRDAIFGKGTYSDLRQAGRPFIVINANDTAKGSRFVFVQGQFDSLCATLAGYPVARAVTASSAVDGVFAPIKVRNFSPSRRNCPPEPAWVGPALLGEPPGVTVVETPRDRRRRARLVRWYRTGEPYGLPGARQRPYYAHLADGGSIDNTALWPLLRALASPVSDWGLRDLIASGRVRRVLLIAVNAMSSPDAGYDRIPAGPTVSQALEKAFGRAQKTATRDAVRIAEVLFARLRKYGLDRGRGRRVAFHGPVVIDFAGIRDDRRRRCFNNIKTALDLPATQVDALRRLAVRQLEADPRYRRFLKSVEGRRVGRLNFRGAADFCAAGTTVAGKRR